MMRCIVWPLKRSHGIRSAALASKMAMMALMPACALAAEHLDCPLEPPAIAQAAADVRDSIRASANEVGKVATSELESRLRARYRRLAPGLLEQALHAAYCQRLRAQPQLSEAQRVKRWKALHSSAELEVASARKPSASAPPFHTALAAPAGLQTNVSLRTGGAAAPVHVPPAAPFEQIPQFPWPPPPASASRVIPAAILTARVKELDRRTGRAPAADGHLHLRDTAAVLRHALRGAGYDFRYYATPRGFAMAAPLERIDDQGTPYPQPARFDATYRPLENFSLPGYLKALFLAPPGHYRVITFIISPVAFRASGRLVSSQEAGAWLDGGVNVLPKSVGDLEYNLPDYAATALIYEFEKRDTQTNPVELLPGRLSADTHLERSGIARLLWNQDYP